MAPKDTLVYHAHISPFLVCGIGRSGTSALLRAVGQHRDIANFEKPGEAPFLSSFIAFLSAFEDTDPAADYNRKNYRLEDGERLSYYRGLISTMTTPVEYRDEITRQHSYWPAKATLPNRTLFDKLLTIFPDTRGFYIVRNGIEVVNSMRGYQGFSELTFEDCCKRWNNSVRNFSYLEALPMVAMLRHDTMVADPRHELNAAFTSIGMDPDDRVGDFLASKFHNSSFESSGKFDLASRTSVALSDWSAEEKAMFDEICSEGMHHLGYERQLTLLESQI